MSHGIVLQCTQDGCHERFHSWPVLWTEALQVTLRNARGQAHLCGWTISADDDLDYCPEHSETRLLSALRKLNVMGFTLGRDAWQKVADHLEEEFLIIPKDKILSNEDFGAHRAIRWDVTA